MKIMKTILVSILLAFVATASSGQKTNLDKLSEKERNEYLVKVTKEAIMQYAPGWYRDGEPKIERRVETIKSEIERHGKVAYKVVRYYDKSKEEFPYGYSTEVWVNEESGKVCALGVGGGYGVSGLDHPELWEEGTVIFYEFDPELYRKK